MVVPGRRSQPNHRVSPPPPPEKSDNASVLSQGSTTPSDISPAVPVETIYKLLAFTFAMICGPLAAYFLSVKTFFSGNATLAGALAALTANVVLIAYVVVAWQEDKEDQAKRREKKGQ
ncbi:uncharacterized protein BHQ10_008251 [Talaromyces amestolkiae]|uniref:Uncharacterized protein n=1 Tax=Talaromyces amestolkiae TaxID=1196081 RepID=A0A364L8X9_TALAM|nr:uncharacterized protein BHQ10_008251 [Talaromyces amestolkiae]RAO72239.1 hypothetical protein BHQ10_008251 [Talaromyces amestolkiae]